MARIIAIANHKGGVGKTTTALNLAGYYATQGYRVLLCDLDPQASLTKLLGFAPEALRLTLSDLLLQSNVGAEVVYPTSIAGVQIVPANGSLAATEKTLITKMNRERTLARVLAPLAPAYDYVLLDCPPALDLLNTNGLAAADEVLIPLQSSTLALQALPDFLRTVDAVKREINPQLRVARIVLTMHQGNTGHSQDVLRAILARFPGQISDATVPLSVAAKDSAASGTSIFAYDPTSGVAEAYRRLAEELTHA